MPRTTRAAARAAHAEQVVSNPQELQNQTLKPELEDSRSVTPASIDEPELPEPSADSVTPAPKTRGRKKANKKKKAKKGKATNQKVEEGNETDGPELEDDVVQDVAEESEPRNFESGRVPCPCSVPMLYTRGHANNTQPCFQPRKSYISTGYMLSSCNLELVTDIVQSQKFSLSDLPPPL